MVNSSIGGLTITDFVKLTVPMLAAMCAWLWAQISSNRTKSNENTSAIALLDQALRSQTGKVNGMEDEVKKLSNELTQVKFSLQSLDHKQDQHHIELMNEIKNLSK